MEFITPSVALRGEKPVEFICSDPQNSRCELTCGLLQQGDRTNLSRRSCVVTLCYEVPRDLREFFINNKSQYITYFLNSL